MNQTEILKALDKIKSVYADLNLMLDRVEVKAEEVLDLRKAA